MTTLPTLNLPKHPFTIPSTGKKTTIRPFTVREEKLLLVAKEARDPEQIMTATKDVLAGCIADVDVEKLAMFDLEFALLRIRAVSVSNLVELRIVDPESKEQVELELDINTIEMVTHPDHDKMISLDDDITIVMRYPTLTEFQMMTENPDNPIVGFDVMVACIDQIVQGDQVFKTEDFSDEELLTFIDGFSKEHIKKVKGFFETSPTMAFELPYRLKDGTEKTFSVKGSEVLFM